MAQIGPPPPLGSVTTTASAESFGEMLRYLGTSVGEETIEDDNDHDTIVVV